MIFRRPHFIDSCVLFAYTIISVVMTWPLVANLRGKYLYYGGIDELQFVWNFWWMHYALDVLHTSPLRTDMIFQPIGTRLALQADTKLITLLGSPITGIWGPETAYNLAILVAFIFSAFTMYLLVDYLVQDKRAAFLGGCVFAFSTFKFAQSSGHLHIISTEFFPLYVLFFIKMLREPNPLSPGGERVRVRGQYRHASFAGISLGLIFLTDYYQTVYAAFFSIAYLLYYLLGRTSAAGIAEQHSRRVSDLSVWRGLLTRLTVVALMFAIVGAPLLYADAVDLSDGYYVKWSGEGRFYADVAGFFVPATKLAAALPGVKEANRAVIHDGGVESLVYAGWVVIILVAIGIIILTRRLSAFRFWLTFLITCFLFALGPTPHVLGHPLPLPGPYALWAAIPLLNNARIPSRFDLLITFAAAVLVGYSVREIIARLSLRMPRIRPALLSATFLVLITPLLLVEHFYTPLSAKSYALNQIDYLYQIAAQPGDFTVLNLPTYGADSPEPSSMYEQTIHQKRVLEVYISRPLPYYATYYGNEEFISLMSSQPDGPQAAAAGMQQVLSDSKALNFYRLDAARLAYYLDIRYIIVHPQWLPGGGLRFLNLTLPLTQVYSDDPNPDAAHTIIYQVDSASVAAQAQMSDLELGAKASAMFRLLGWSDGPISDADGTSYMPMSGNQAQILAPVREPADYTVTITLKPASGQQTMRVYVNDGGNAAASVTLSGSGWQTQTVTIPASQWQEGMNKLTLKVDSGSGTAVRGLVFTKK